jgi:hypothetical protein
VNGEFLDKLTKFLCQQKLDDVLGVRVLDKHNPTLTVEVTEGKMNMMVSRGTVPDNELIPALWSFGKDEDQACHCREFCRVDKGSHVEKNHSCG